MNRLTLQWHGFNNSRKKELPAPAATTTAATHVHASAVVSHNTRCETSSSILSSQQQRDQKKKLFENDIDDEEDNDHDDKDDDDNNCCCTVSDDDDDITAPTVPNSSERSSSSAPTVPNKSASGGNLVGRGGKMVKQRSVRWSTIEFYNHEVVLGDHPSVDGGPPLSIGWKSIGQNEFSIDAYESDRPERRCKDDLIVPADVRHRWLIESGYSRSEIKDCLLELAYIQESRRKNAQIKKPWEKFKGRLAATFRTRASMFEVRAFDE